ncbi:hypothetical protein [Streptomyces sp. PH10-H1]|uniref:hypothetical protein n=1 Tax=Streptomyces sp. PH10-H1 TaxID=3046212 RepID=UPI0024B9AC9F|nr:hypothetical protein [Streptomyces sp. PH10-H1]MDJ0341784.1 hypothetical protein [Streptomyces sp. PH10-H1]
MYHPDPDRAHDPLQSAADALTELGHTPGLDSVTQLKHVAAELIRRKDKAQAAIGDLTATANPPSAAALLNLVALCERAGTALAPLVESQLDGMEQALLADLFQPGDQGGGS